MGIDILIEIGAKGESIFTEDEIELLQRAFDNNIFDVIEQYALQIDSSLITDKPRTVIFDLLVRAARLIIDTRKGKTFAKD